MPDRSPTFWETCPDSDEYGFSTRRRQLADLFGVSERWVEDMYPMYSDAELMQSDIEIERAGRSTLELPVEKMVCPRCGEDSHLDLTEREVTRRLGDALFVVKPDLSFAKRAAVTVTEVKEGLRELDRLAVLDRERCVATEVADRIRAQAATVEDGLAGGIEVEVRRASERRSASTRAGMQRRKAAGVHLGRPVALPVELRSRLAAERAAGLSFQKIATALNAEGIPTAHGGSKWYPSTIKAALETVSATSR